MNDIIVDSGEEWTFEKIEDIYEHIEDIAVNEFKIDAYFNQLEVISAEQMLDAYCSVGMPIMYSHWSYGESFVRQQEAYNRGHMGLAYEIVINSDPCIAYLMEENTMLMQTLVIAHASFGHNHFFKNNYLFKQWTDADGIVDYLAFAKKYINECEEKYGFEEVETVLDAAHALQQYGIDKYNRPTKLSAAQEQALRKEREAYNQSQRNEIWNTVPHTKDQGAEDTDERFPAEPEENILYFIEKNAPNMPDWQREIIRIVRKISQYFYPQRQTQLMNEGFATYTHYTIMQKLHERGNITDGAMLEFIQSHTGVVLQPEYNDPRHSGINPYALGFAMMQDIERVANNPTEEDREWFGSQDWVGSGDHISAIQFAVANFKDESFVRQYLSPTIIRKFKLFSIIDDEQDSKIEISAIHNKQGYAKIRDALSKQYNIGYMVPDIQVTNVDRWGDRQLTLEHTMVNNKPLNSKTTPDVLQYILFLWGYPVKLKSIQSNGTIAAVYDVSDTVNTIDIFLDD